MKMTVVINKAGKVISTYHQPEKPGKDDPTLQIFGGPGSSVREVELEDKQTESVGDLHKRVAEHLKKLGK
jgi:hypothetical protein